MDTNGTRVPTTFWLVAGVGTLWNGYGCVDYVMVVSHNPAWLARMTPAMAAQVAAMPAWAVAGWAIGVWASLAGSLLLLARRSVAVPAFALSLVGALVGFFYQYMANMLQNLAFPALILAMLAGLLWYARRSAARGWLS